MKKVCFLTHSLDIKRGGGRLSLDFVTSLNNAGMETIVLTSLKTDSKIDKSILYTNKIKLIFSFREIRKVVKECDMIHAFDVFPYGIIAIIANIGLKKKIVITAIGSSSLRPLYKFGISLLSRIAFKKADAVTAISHYVAREINKKIPELNFKIIIPGINYQYFVSKSFNNTNQIKEKPYILSVAKLKPRKGHHVSLTTFKKASEKISDLNFVIVGKCKGDYFDEIKKLVTELNIKEKVFFKENISDHDLIFLYKNAEMFMLLPQNDDNDIEGFGLVFVEAAAFGLPVIGASDSGAEDAILDGKNGFLVAPDDIDGASQKIIKIFTDRNLRDQFSKKSVEFAKENDWSNIIKKYIELYNSLN